jgi:hypothetical protein
MGDVLYDEETKLYSAVVRVGGPGMNFTVKEHTVPELHEAKNIINDMKNIRLVEL